MVAATERASASRAVPVALRASGRRRERLTRIVEGALGWPVVDLHDPMMPPVALVADVAAVHERPGPADPRDVPVVLLVGDDDDPIVAAAAGAGVGAVLAWPPDVERLRRAVLGNATVVRRRPWCTLAASAGGVGATTVALALAAVRAWRTGRVLAALSGPAHVAAAPTVAAEDLASPAAWAAGAVVVGVAPLRVVSISRRGTDAPAAGDVTTVVDVGVLGVEGGLAVAPDVLVARPDRAGLVAAEATPARIVLVAGDGPAARRDVVAAAGSRTVVRVRSDPRIAAACHRGRHPTDAPGAWLRPLAGVVARLDGVSGRAAAGP